MQELTAFDRILALVRDLRERCRWDRAQTPQSLRNYLVEEVLELDQALRRGDPREIESELGDLMLHLAFQIVLGEETGGFDQESVGRKIERKMWRRHPHLFEQGDEPRSWERQKLEERAEGGLLDTLPEGMPPLVEAFRVQERAAGVGFDWPDEQGPIDKVTEELDELEAEVASGNSERIEAEIGDLLFAAVNLSRKLQCDPRAALEKANDRFRRRFGIVERLARERGVDLAQAGLDELDRLWEEAKELLDQG